MRIIPAIDLMAGQVVRLYKGDPRQKTTYSDDPVAVARQWERDGADMLHVVDLDATLGRGSNLELAMELSRSVRIPVEIAGGLRSEQSATEAAMHADRIVLGTMAFQDVAVLGRLASAFGHERIVISVDHMDGQVMIRGWQAGAGIKLLDAIKGMTGTGFTEFLLTDVGRDGTMQGPDLEYLAKACQIPCTNIISSGGISGLQDVVRVREAGASGVILGKALYEGRLDIRSAKAS